MNLWNWFNKKDVKDLFLEFSPYESGWRVVTWNFDGPGRVVEVHHQNMKTLIQWGAQEIKYSRDGKLLRKEPHNLELKSLMNLAIHSVLKMSLETNNEFMLTPVPGATTMDMQNELKALQWIQASFRTLALALDKFDQDSSLILTAALFSGTVPESGENVFRLIVFNLDIFFYLKSDLSLQIVIFDDKNQMHGSSRSPIFQQIIKVTKPQFYDEIVRLIHRLAILGEIK